MPPYVITPEQIDWLAGVRRSGRGMRLIRVHVEEALAAGARIALRGTAAAHVRRVLRLEAGDSVTLFNGDGLDYPSRIGASRRDAVEVEVTGTSPARAESPLDITLVQGIARTERMDLVVQKATELGVAAIQPVATVRSVVKLDADSRARKSAHWRGIAVAACEQCGHTQGSADRRADDARNLACGARRRGPAPPPACGGGGVVAHRCRDRRACG